MINRGNAYNEKLISTFLAFAILALSLFVFVSAEKSTDKTIKKMVSIVYDDSGSMKDNDKYAYASYSLQNLVSLFNPQDELNVVKMSDSTKNVPVNMAENSTRSKDI